MGAYIAKVKETDDRETPDEFYAELDREFHFTRDVCASHLNRKHVPYWTIEDDALSKDWSGVCWMNPPYSQSGLWMQKAYEESQKGTTVVCLVPSATDTKWWHEWAEKGEVRFVKGRLRFKGTPSSAPFPSAVIIFRGASEASH